MTRDNGPSGRNLIQKEILMQSSRSITIGTGILLRRVNVANILTHTVTLTNSIITVTGSNNRISNRNQIENRIPNGCASTASSHTILTAKKISKNDDAVEQTLETDA